MASSNICLRMRAAACSVACPGRFHKRRKPASAVFPRRPSIARMARAGGQLYVEVMHNLVLKGTWLPVGDKLGPRYLVGLEYMKCLVDDVLPFARECAE